MNEITSEVTLSTPCHVRSIVKWQLTMAKKERESFYPLITARVFTAMMFEGVISYIGEIVISDWEDEPETGRPKSHRNIGERHKMVRRAIKLSNDGEDYREISDIIHAVFKFRDRVAHPKVHTDTVTQSFAEKNLNPIPSIEWEKDIDEDKISTDFDLIEEYSHQLCEHAAD